MKYAQKKCSVRSGFILCAILMWILKSCPVNAARLYFPYYADTWPQIHTEDMYNALALAASDPENGLSKNENTLSDDEMDTLYKVVSMECDTGYEGSLAVISCMLNRQASEKYPDNLMDVIREDSQFTAYYDRHTDTYPYLDREPSSECIAAVDDALEKGKRNIPSYIYYFRSSDYDYLQGYISYGQIGDNTYFYQYEDQE
ncbi:MAG: cell wall hydrolase [Eubacterium sp.]|nr:cell wall hydrolase [Eubacterium sp.]